MTTWGWIAQCREEDANGLCSWNPSSPLPTLLCMFTPARLAGQSPYYFLGQCSGEDLSQLRYRVNHGSPSSSFSASCYSGSQVGGTCVGLHISGNLGPVTWYLCLASTMIKSHYRPVILALLQKQYLRSRLPG